MRFLPRAFCCLCAGVLGLPGPAWPAGQADTAPCEDELRRALDGLAREVTAGDVEGALDCYSDTWAGTSEPFTKKDVRELLERLQRTSRSMSLSYQHREFHCAGDLAVVVTTESFRREPPDQAPAQTIERDLQIHFQKQNGRWRMLCDLELDPEASPLRAGEEYRMPQQGFAVTLPAGYRYRAAKVPWDTVSLIGVTDDLKLSLLIRAKDLGVTIRPDQLGDIATNQLGLFLPDCRTAARRPSRVKGLPAVLVDTECPGFKGVIWCRTALILDRKDLLVVSLEGRDEHLRTEALAGMDNLFATLRRIPKEPSAAGCPAPCKGPYRSDKYGMEISLPGGWKTEVREGGRFITAKAPSGAGTVMVVVVDLLEELEAGALLEKDEQTTSRIVTGFTCEKRGPIEVGGLVGAQSISRFDLGEGVKRWRAYFTRGRRAYLIVCDAQPPEEFEKLQPEFRRTIESLRVESPAKSKGAAETGQED